MDYTENYTYIILYYKEIYIQIIKGDIYKLVRDIHRINRELY